MRRTVLALSTLAVLIFVSVPFAAAEWQENLVTNNTLEEIYVIKSTWQAANSNKGIPAGFWTRGSYRLDPGKSRVFYSWDTNSIYFRISNADGAIKANSGTTASAFWSHPKRSFRVVSQTLDTSVTTDQLLYSDRPNNQLVQLEGFVSYTGGSAVVVTPEWVSLDGQPTAPPNDELGDDGGRPGEDVAPPAWVASVITNATEADLYVVYATWKLENSKKGYPEGFRTRGTYRIRPGKGRVFHSWADNEIYYRIANTQGALKPEASSETFGFWLHPSRSFRLVSDQVAATVERSGLSYSDRSTAKLVQSDGFMVYESGSDVVVTADWVPVVPVDDGNGGNGNDVEDGTPVPPETPTPPTPPTSPVIPVAPAGMVLIPAGSLEITGTYEKTVSLDAFYMDKYEVTNAEYAAFLNAKGRHAVPGLHRDEYSDTGQRWIDMEEDSGVRIELVNGSYRVKAGYENHPVTHVSWHGAMVYAAWAGKRLPTESEWEYASRGGKSKRSYSPSGDTFQVITTAVGSYAANGYGVYDMARNVHEWCLDAHTAYFDGTFYAVPPKHSASANKHSISAPNLNSFQWLVANYESLRNSYPFNVGHRILRGSTPYIPWGEVYVPRANIWVGGRKGIAAGRVDSTNGFRCVKSVSPAPANTGTPTPPKTPMLAKTPPPPKTSDVPAGMVLIPAGKFQMGPVLIDGSRSGQLDEFPDHPVSLDAFYMDTHEVTNAEYAAFLNAKGKHSDAGKTWLDLTDSDTRIVLVDGAYSAKAGYANHPVVRVSWYGAMAYAAWAGKKLPTEAQWEYAARGGLAGKLYPWGNTIDTTRANHGRNTGGTTAVGSYAANDYGLYDMAGNVFEWCLDAYEAYIYRNRHSLVHNPSPGADGDTMHDYTPRVLRSGSYLYSAFDLRISNRGYSYPMSTGGDLGFRCVKPASP